MSVTVIIPVYNDAPHIEKAMRSVMEQTETDWKLIVVNDGSQDDTGLIAHEIAKEDHRITVIDQENKGLVGAEITGYQNADSEWIMFLDSDDWYEPDMVKTLLKAVSENHADAARLGYKKVFPDGREEFPLTIVNEVLDHEMIETMILHPFFEENADIYRHWSAPRWEKIYRSSLLKEPFEKVDVKMTAGEDLALNLRFLTKAGKVVNVADSFLYAYRVLDSSMGRGYTEKMRRQYQRMQEAIELIAEEQHRPFAAREKLQDNSTMSLLYELKHTETMDKAERKAIQKQLEQQLNDPKLKYKLMLYEDFPGKAMLQSIYRKIRK